MGPDTEEEVGVVPDFEKDAVAQRDSDLPIALRSFHPFQAKRRMPWVCEELRELTINTILDELWQPLIIMMKTIGVPKVHGCLRRAVIAALAVVKVPEMRPSVASASASRIASCHSSVQKYR